MAKEKQKRIVALEHSIVSMGIGAPSMTLAPGDFVVFEEDNDSHKAIEQEIATGANTSLEIQEVDMDAEQTQRDPLEGPHPDDVLQAPARALEQEVREAQVAQGDDAKQPKEARDDAKATQESVEAEQQRQAEEAGEPPAGRQSRKKS